MSGVKEEAFETQVMSRRWPGIKWERDYWQRELLREACVCEGLRAVYWLEQESEMDIDEEAGSRSLNCL